MEHLPSDIGKNTWDDHDDDDTTPAGGKKTKPAAPLSIFKEPVSPPKPDARPSLFNLKERAEKAEENETSKEGDAEYDDNESLDGELDKLTPEEVQVVVQHYVAERTKVLDQEIADADPDSPTTPIVQADKRLLEALDERTQSEADSSLDDSLEQAAAEVLQELGQENGDEQESEAAEDDETTRPTGPAGTAAATPHAHGGHAPTAPAHHGHPARPAASTGAAGAAAAARPSPAAPAPTPAAGGTPPPIAHGPGFGGPPAPASPNLYPSGGAVYNTAPAAPVAEQSAAPEQTKDRLVQGLLIGGVVGYLVGRRRGRIKTEKRLLPIQEKLQKEVSELQQKIVSKEQEVRSVVAQKSILEQAVKSKAEKPKPIVGTPEKSVVAEHLKVQSETAEPTPQAPKVERPRFPQTEKPRSPQQAKVEQIVQDQNVDHLPLAKVVLAAEAIVISGTSLARSFEAGHIDEAGLRHVVEEFARTGHAERSFKTEVNAQEKRKQSSEKIQTILSPEETVRKKPLTSRSRDTGYVSVQHDLTPMDTASLAPISTPSKTITPNKTGSTSPKAPPRPTPQSMLVLAAILLVLAVAAWIATR